MLPDKISKFKFRIRSSSQFRLSSEPNINSKQQYLHSRRRYLINSIPLLSIVALLVGISSVLLNMIMNNGSCYAIASTSLTIDGGSSKTISETTAPNETKYVSSNVSYSATDTSAYTLKLTYANGSSALALDNGSGSSSTTTIPDVVNNTTGSSIKNAWGYSWTSTDNTNYEGIAYNAIPAYGSSTNIETGTTISSTTKQLVFAANLSDSNPTGHYKTNLLLSLVATPTATTRTLTYNANSGSPTPTAQTCADYGDGCTITMSYTTPTRSGYTFKGWGDSTSTVNSNYGSGKTITLTTNKTIYAVWESTDPWANITTMQQMTTSACSAASVGKSKTLTDSRDNSTYTVQKYPDGKCWMTQNLKLMGSRTLTSSDSDVSSNFTLPASSISGFSDNTAVNAYLSGSTGYYTWCAATAGTCSSATSNGANATSSICPKGWKLPTGGRNSKTTDFWLLFRNMGLTISTDSLDQTGSGTAWGTGDLAKAQGSPYNFAYTGSVDYGTFYDPASYQNGRWWSRTASSSTYAYFLYIDSGYVYPGTGDSYRRSGSAVRCVAK